MADLGDDVELAAARSREDATRLRIHHLFVLTAFAAVGLTASRCMFSGWAFFVPPTYWMAIAAIPVVLSAGLGAVSLIVVWWRLRRRIRAIQPGEWVAIIPTADFLFLIGAGLFSLPLTKLVGQDIASRSVILIAVIFYMCLAVFLCRLILTANESRWWKTFYALLLVDRLSTWAYLLLSIDTAIYYEDLSVYTCWTIALPCVLVATMLIAACKDLTQRRKPRWTSWLGIVCYGGLALFTTGNLVFEIFFS